VIELAVGVEQRREERNVLDSRAANLDHAPSMPKGIRMAFRANVCRGRRRRYQSPIVVRLDARWLTG
jgi:hypothetical protein